MAGSFRGSRSRPGHSLGSGLRSECGVAKDGEGLAELLDLWLDGSRREGLGTEGYACSGLNWSGLSGLRRLRSSGLLWGCYGLGLGNRSTRGTE